jgi:hypothetical protein
MIMNGEQIGLEISEMINNFNNTEDINGMLSILLNEHKTLQQTFCGKFVLNYIRKMALKYKNGDYDDRNQASVECCNIMWEALKEKCPDYFADDQQVRLAMI